MVPYFVIVSLNDYSEKRLTEINKNSSLVSVVASRL